MVKKTIKFTDYDGHEREKDYFFNLSRAEIIKMDAHAGKDGGLQKQLERIAHEEDTSKIMDFFEKFIMNAIGEKSGDGVRFIKSPEITEAFVQSEAYSELLVWMLAEPNEAAKFIEKVLPAQETSTAASAAISAI